MKKVLMGSVFAMILAAGITTSLAAPGGYRAADRDGICDYTAQSSGWAYPDEDNDGVCDYAGQGGCGYADADGDGVCDYYGEGVCDFGGGTRPMDGTGYRRCGRSR